MRYGLILLVVMATVLSSCNGGSVNVVQSGSSPAPSTVGQGLTTNGGGPTPAETSSQPTVFFDAFEMSQTSLGSAVGVGFLPANSQVSDAFELDFTCASAGCVFLPSATGFVLALPEAFGETLETFQLSTLQPTTLFQSQAPIVAMAGDPAGAWLAFANGSASLTVRTTTSSHSLPLAQSGSITALASAAGNLLLVTMGSSSTLYQLSVSDQGASVSELKTIPSAQVAISPSGDQLSWISANQDGSSEVNLWDQTAGSTQSLSTASGSVSDLAILSSNVVIFRSTTSSTDSIEQANFSSSAVAPIVSLAPGAPPAGSVCPVVVNGAIYYADRDGSSFSVFRASPDSEGVWTATPFAVPNTEDGIAYLCPKSWQGSTQ